MSAYKSTVVRNSGMKTAHLFLDPLIKFGDVALQQHQFPLGLDEHLSDVHRGHRVVHPGEDNYLFKKGRGNRDVSDHVDVCIQEYSSAEFRHEDGPFVFGPTD